MRVAVANKFWYRRGGLESVMFDEIALLEAAGHEVSHFSTNHPDNEPSPWSDYFVPYLELGASTDLRGGDRMRAAVRMFANHQASERFKRVMDVFRPDVVHVHGIHRQLSPSLLDVARRLRIPVVQTLHDYHHVCPADRLLRGGVHACMPRSCGTLRYGPAVRHRCVRGSRPASALSALETAFQRVRRVYQRGIARFVCPSRFMRDMMVEGGWDRSMMAIVPNAVSLDAPAPSRGYVLYAGRLSAEKGVDVLLESGRRAGVRVTVAGEGPLGDELGARYPDAEFLGRVDGDKVAELVRHAVACIVPSIWFENAPMSVLEPMAAGVPVIASAIGGIPEIARDGVDGLLVPPGDVGALAGALEAVSSDPDLRQRLGAAARARIAKEYSPECHLERLTAVYEEVMAS